MRLVHIVRHPVKAHGREELASAVLSAGRCLPFDRHWAVAHDLSKFDPAEPAWVSCANFQRGARTPAVMAIAAAFNEGSGVLTLTHPNLAPISFRPDDPGDAARFLDWVAPISPSERFRPAALVAAPGRGMTDSAWPSVSLAALETNAAVGAHLGMDLSIHRWRANFWLEGLEPFGEFALVGRRIRLGGAVLAVEERIGRCKATSANPASGTVDADTLGALRDLCGAQDFGVFARVESGGPVAPGDRLEIL